MATTPTYSWPIPDDTDLVKDGAEAIRDLGNAIDTTVGGLGSGLVHINTTSFSAVASQSFDNVFSATYDNYYVTAKFTGKTTNDFVSLRLRASGSDNSTSNYYSARTEINWSGSSGAYGQNADSSMIMTYAEALGTSYNFECYVAKPFLAEVTNFFNRAIRFQSGGKTHWLNGSMVVASSFDGFSLVTSGNMTGELSIYGYRK